VPSTARRTEPDGAPDGVVVDYRALAEWRYRIRKFLAFSETAARSVGLAPQQHQLLLAIKGLPPDLAPTIQVLSERLSLQPHSLGELIDRLVEKGLLRRNQLPEDGRNVRVILRPKAERLLEKLSIVHMRQLEHIGPDLIAALSVFVKAAPEPPPND
jgi:DNA-binding MarR family transcriptional regulator